MTRSPPKDPLITVIGATGTGKSDVSNLYTYELVFYLADHRRQLAVALARRYNGEIINGDAMQLYAGLPIITNKITTEEQQGVPHHLLGRIGLHEQTWVVGTFVKNALKIIEDIRSRGNLPILVGGTHYYTQKLLFENGLPDEDGEGEDSKNVVNKEESWAILQEPTEVILEELRKVDPVMADRWHPKDRRKIQRSLEMYLQTGRKASEIYAEQREQSNGLYHVDGGEGSMPEIPSTRFSTILFWVHADADALRERLDVRVDKMLERGLLDEVQHLHAFANAETAVDRPTDETRGIWVSIGYKEFRSYAQALETDGTSDAKLQQLKSEALERTKIATRQYAKRQVRWIRIKLVNAVSQANASQNLYLLDGSDVANFEQDVVAPAIQLTHNFLGGAPVPEPASLSVKAAELLIPKREYDLAATPEKWVRQYCDLCGVTTVTEEQWSIHIKSKAHRKLVNKAKSGDGRSRLDVASGQSQDVQRSPT